MARPRSAGCAGRRARTHMRRSSRAAGPGRSARSRSSVRSGSAVEATSTTPVRNRMRASVAIPISWPRSRPPKMAGTIAATPMNTLRRTGRRQGPGAPPRSTNDRSQASMPSGAPAIATVKATSNRRVEPFMFRAASPRPTAAPVTATSSWMLSKSKAAGPPRIAIADSVRVRTVATRRTSLGPPIEGRARIDRWVAQSMIVAATSEAVRPPAGCSSAAAWPSQPIQPGRHRAGRCHGNGRQRAPTPMIGRGTPAVRTLRRRVAALSRNGSGRSSWPDRARRRLAPATTHHRRIDRRGPIVVTPTDVVRCPYGVFPALGIWRSSIAVRMRSAAASASAGRVNRITATNSSPPYR